MEPRLETLAPKLLAGRSVSMCLANNQIPALWQSFMPLRRHINHAVGTDLYSLQVYNGQYSLATFTPNVMYTQWAAIEISQAQNLPEGIGTFELPGGLYAVFIHRGTPAAFPQTLQAIHNQWLPTSGFAIDNRPHFELLGAKYKNNHPDSEEEVWVPIVPN